MTAIREFYENYIRWSAMSMTWSDVLEIAVFAFLIYHLILWIKQSKAWIILKGAAAVFCVYIVAQLLGLNNILLVFHWVAPYLATGLLVIFQPEIRRALEELGTTRIFSVFSISNKDDGISEETVEAITRSAYSMGRTKTGALIVIEQKLSLDDKIATGIVLDAVVSAPLLVQIFEHNTPLHDGAVIVRGNRVVAATCYLTLSENKSISKELGTRHRAGLGISEVTDSVTVIVSEETGQVSLAKDGRLYRNLESKQLRDMLGALVHKPQSRSWMRLRKGKQKDGE